MVASIEAQRFSEAAKLPESDEAHRCEGKNMNFDQELDARGLNCPLPILKAKKSLTGLASGQVLKIVATDPGSVKDFEAFAKQTGNGLLSSTTSGNEFIFFLRKK